MAPQTLLMFHHGTHGTLCWLKVQCPVCQNSRGLQLCPTLGKLGRKVELLALSCFHFLQQSPLAQAHKLRGIISELQTRKELTPAKAAGRAQGKLGKSLGENGILVGLGLSPEPRAVSLVLPGPRLRLI